MDQQTVDRCKRYRDRVEKTVKGQRVKNAKVEPTKKLMIKKLNWGYDLMRMVMMEIGELMQDNTLPQKLTDSLKTGDEFVNTCREDIENINFFGRPDFSAIRIEKILKDENKGRDIWDDIKDEKHDERFIRGYELMVSDLSCVGTSGINKIKNPELKKLAHKYLKETYELYKWALKDAGEIKELEIKINKNEK